MRTLAQVILVRPDGSVILQHRPEVAGTPGSDIVTAFGGPALPNETPQEAAAHELADQTNLDLDPEELIFWREYPKFSDDDPAGRRANVFYFLVTHVDSRRLKLTDALGSVIVHSETDARKINTTKLFRRVLSDYFHERRKAQAKR